MNGITRLLSIMQRLRDPERGCEWDRAQSFATIAPYTIEEAYEVADAIANDDPEALREELGDLLLQVVFHAQIAADLDLFTFDQVAHAISDKMERRHPHIFGPVDAERGIDWEAQKAAERMEAGATSALDGVAQGLPALLRATKLQARAARVGFDWPDRTGPRAKVDEELSELDVARTADERTEEAGDLLFALVNLLRKSDIDPEAALRSANAKFERRFRAMEDRAAGTFSSLSLAEQDRLWNAVKAAETGQAGEG